MPLNQIPEEFLKQFYLESQTQTLGSIEGSIGPLPAAESGGSAVAAPLPAQPIVNQSTMIQSSFVSSYNGINNANRNYLLIQNNGTGVMYVALSGAASAGNSLQIAIGGYWEPFAVPINSFRVLGTGTVIEGVTVQ